MDPDIHGRFLCHSLPKCEQAFILYPIDFHIHMKTVRYSVDTALVFPKFEPRGVEHCDSILTKITGILKDRNR